MPQYCLVKHHIVSSVIDGPDVGNEPDTLPVSGNVTFHPILDHGDSVVVTAGEEKISYILAPITARIVDGKISVEGEEGVKLFAGGPDTNPERIRYRAKFTGLNISGKKVELKNILFEAVPGGELSLAVAQSVPGAPYPGYSASIEQGIKQIESTRDGAVDFAVLKINETRDEVIHEADLAIQAAKDANAVPRVTALEAMNGVSPESPVDGQTANLVIQEDTLTRAALEEQLASESLASARAQKKLMGKKMALVLRHDDVQANALQYLPLYDELGVKASWYVVSQHMGTTQRGIIHAAETDIIDLHEAGHEIGSHTQTHLYFDQATEAQRRAELAGSKRDLETLLGGGYRCETFAYPGNFGSYEREVGDYYIWGTTGVPNNTVHGETHTLTEIDTVSNKAEYPYPLMGSTVAETITKTKAILAGYKSREALTVYTLQSHNLNEVPLDHMRAILETVIADPDAEVVTMREAAHYVRASLRTQDGRFYAPYSVTTGEPRRAITLLGDKHASGGYIVDRKTSFGKAFIAKVDGEPVSSLDTLLTLFTAETSRLENGHRLAMYSPDNSGSVNMGVEAGNVFTVNTSGSVSARLRGSAQIIADGDALRVADTTGTTQFTVKTENQTVLLRSRSSLPATSITNEICNLNGTLFICTLGGSPGRWEPIGTKSGTTSQRPTGAAVVTGVSYFDTTLGKPVWWNGTSWVDATGTAV